MFTPNALDRLVRKLERHSPLDRTDRAALLGLPFTARRVDQGTYIVREGETPLFCGVLLSGFAYRHKITGGGARQIISVHVPGEFIDLQNSLLEISDHSVQTLSRADVALVPKAEIQDITDRLPNVRRALWTESLIDASIFREWTVNVGRRPSIARVAHLLCELAERLEAAGLAKRHSYELPMTQEQLADAVGLTPVHVNRVLKELGREGLIGRDKRTILIPDWERLREIGDFNARYLHLHQGEALRPYRERAA